MFTIFLLVIVDQHLKEWRLDFVVIVGFYFEVHFKGKL